MNEFESRGFFNCNYHWGYLMFHYDIANLVNDELFTTIKVKLASITNSLEL
jgi:hypothetical protein